MWTLPKMHPWSTSKSGGKSAGREYVYSDRIYLLIVFLVVLGVFALAAWLASFGPPPEMPHPILP